MPDNLQDSFCKIGDFILPVFLDWKYEPRVFKPNIHQHYSLKVYLSLLSNVE